MTNKTPRRDSAESRDTAKGLDAIFEIYFAGLPEPGTQAAHEMVEANREYHDRKRAEDEARAAEARDWADFHDLILN